MDKKIKLGIIGYGNIGQAHARNIEKGKCPHVELVAIADLKPERLELAKTEVAETVTMFDDAYKMLDSGIIDSVLVAVPHYDHPVFAHECFNRGLHVIIEKPAGVYTKQVREMNEAAKKSGVTFAVMFNERTNCIYRKMRELVKDGGFGEIKRTNWIITNWYRPQMYYDSGSWRATWKGEGGGVLLNQCPHNLDLWQWICGMPKKVTATMKFGKWHNIEVEDDVTAVVEYENGATGVFITSTGDAPGTNRFEITMDKAKIVAENKKLTVWELDVAESEFSKNNTEPFGQPKVTVYEPETDGENPQHSGVLNAFADNILEGKPLIAAGEEGINGLTISNAMHLSAWLGKTIELPFDEDLFYSELKKRIDNSKYQKTVREAVADMEKSYNKG